MASIFLIVILLHLVFNHAYGDNYVLTSLNGRLNYDDVTIQARSHLHCATKCDELKCFAFSIGQGFMCRITLKEKVMLKRHRVVEEENTRLYMVKGVPRSCLDVNENQEMVLFSSSGGLDRVFCMGTGKRRSIAFHPSCWRSMASQDLEAYNPNRQEVLLFFQAINRTLEFGVLKQLVNFENVSLGFNSNPDRLAISFVPQDSLVAGTTNGFRLNSVEISFAQCSGNQKSSHILLYTNENAIRSLPGSTKPFPSSDMASKVSGALTATTDFEIPESYLTFANFAFGKTSFCGMNVFVGLDGVTQGAAIGFFLS